MMNDAVMERVMNSMKENVFLRMVEARVMIFHPGRKKTIESAERE